MAIKVSQIAFHHTADTQYQGRMDGQELTSLAYICITRAEQGAARSRFPNASR